MVRPSWSVALLVIAIGARVARAGWRRWRQRGLTRIDAAAASSGVVLGVEATGRPVVLSDRELSAHGLILGASGAGKSTTLLAILGSQIERGHPVVAIDLKGSPGFGQALAAAAQRGGRRLRVWTPDGPSQWNPLAHGNATELKDKLIATERFTEPHYQRAAERYVQTAIGVLEELRGGAEVSLAGVVELLEPRRLAAAARELEPERRERVRDYVESLSGDQVSAVRGLASRLAVITESHSGCYLEPGPDAIDLRGGLEGGDVVLFSLNSSTYGRLSAQLGTLVVQDLVAAAGQRLSTGGRGDLGGAPPATVGIDEFSALGSDNLLALLARGREAGVSVLLATQELADLDRAATGLRDQVLGNTAVKIAHRQDVPASAETVARLVGRERVWERGYLIDPGGGFGALGGVGGGPAGGRRRESLRLVERYPIDPQQVQTLSPGEAVVIVKSPRSSARLARVTPPSRSLSHPPPGVTR